ncbi:MAG: ubiquitin thioesterase OTUB1-like protein [Amphiamblys sp. WSBS2006]|nr:MAG: ubiquitin thioesterase OTUB1-like protein [Amphiamblys sp. WSBS2006]
MEKEEELRQKEIENSVLVAPLEEIRIMAQEYLAGSAEIFSTLMALEEKGWKIRRCRRDGDCFYRGVSFCLVENTQRKSDDEKRGFLGKIKKTLLDGGYDEIVFEQFLDVLADAVFSEENQKKLLELMTDDEKGNSLVVLMRFLTGSHIKQNAEHYSSFLEGVDTASFVQREVETLGKYADHIQTDALSKCIDSPICVFHASSSSSEPRAIFVGPEKPPEIFLLYRPGHYDILYKD